MGNSPSSGQGGSKAYDSRFVERDEFKDGRPNEITKLAAAETKTDIDEPSNSNSPHTALCNNLEHLRLTR